MSRYRACRRAHSGSSGRKTRSAKIRSGQLAQIQELLIQNVEKNLAAMEDMLEFYIKLFGS